MPTSSPSPPRPARPLRGALPGPLTGALVALAGTADDSSWITSQLVDLGRLAADSLPAVHCVSVTAYGDDGYVTVVASSAAASALDEVQYTCHAGPSLDALDAGAPVSVPDLATAVAWAPLRDAADGLGLHALLSIPLFGGRGIALATLNLYGNDRAALAPLAAAVREVFDNDGHADARPGGWGDEAGFVAGLTAAFAVRAHLQTAIEAIAADTGRTPDGAYLTLRLRAAETGASLADTATAVIAERQWRSPA